MDCKRESWAGIILGVSIRIDLSDYFDDRHEGGMGSENLQIRFNHEDIIVHIALLFWSSWLQIDYLLIVETHEKTINMCM